MHGNVPVFQPSPACARRLLASDSDGGPAPGVSLAQEVSNFKLPVAGDPSQPSPAYTVDFIRPMM
jgi:hypothetical protein